MIMQRAHTLCGKIMLPASLPEIFPALKSCAGRVLAIFLRTARLPAASTRAISKRPWSSDQRTTKMLRSTAYLFAACAILADSSVASSSPALPKRAMRTVFGAKHNQTRAADPRRANAAAKAARRAQTGDGGMWPQEHFDMLNR
jgi:hypothetical protein